MRVHVAVVDPATGGVAHRGGALPAFDFDGPTFHLDGAVAGCEATVGVDLVLLRWIRIGDDARLAVTEPACPDELGRTGLGTAEVDAVERDTVVGDVLRRTSRDPDDPDVVTPPWYRSGWFAATMAWADGVLAAAGLERTARPQQTKHWSISAILRFQTTAGDVYLKAVPPLMAHEAALVELLARGAPHVVPRVVGRDAATGTWMARAVESSVAETSEADILSATRALAELQVSMVERVDELVAIGCPVRSAAALADDVAPLLDRDDLLAGLDPEPRERLRRGRARLVAAAADYAEVAPPDSLVHGDFHPGNFLASATGPVVLDWTDGCLSSPRFDLGPLLAHGDDEVRSRIVDAHAGPWVELLGADGWRTATERSGPPTALHHAVSYQRIVDATVGSGDGWQTAVGGFLLHALEQLDALDAMDGPAPPA